MNISRFCWVTVTAYLAMMTAASTAQAGEGKNFIAPTVSFGLETTYGLNSKYVIADHVSFRPSLEFGTSDRFILTGTALSGSITYDFNDSKNSGFQPFVGVGYEINSTQTRKLEAVPTVGFGSPSSGFQQKGSRNFFVEAGSDFNVSPSIVVNTRLRIPLEDTGRDPTFSIGTGFRF